MAIDSQILLAGRTPDFSQIPQNVAQTAQGIMQVRQQQAEAPVRQALLQAQVDQIPLQQQAMQQGLQAGAQGIELKKEQIDALRNDERFKGSVYASLQGRQLLDSNNIPGFIAMATDRIKNVSDRGGDPSGTAQALQLVQSGDPAAIEQAKRMLNSQIAIGERAGILKPNENTGNSTHFVDAKSILAAQGILPSSPGYAERLQSTLTQLQKSGASQSASPYFQFLPTSTGYAVGNARTGAIEQPGAQGQVLLPVPADPNVKGSVAQAEASGAAQGAAAGQAAANLPQTLANADQTLGIINQVINHPGLESAVGIGMMNPTGFIPGTEATNFKVASDQLTGKAFLQAFQSLKGAGAITEQEGSKATAAIARLNRAQSPDEYKKGVRELRDIVEDGAARARKQAAKAAPGGGAASTPSTTGDYSKLWN